MRREDIARIIDHTLLDAEAGREKIIELCNEAKHYRFAGVCVHAGQVKLVAEQLAESNVIPIAVVGFPLGATLGSVKAFEAREAVLHGAREIDMVINRGALKSRDYQLACNEIRGVVEAVSGVPVKVILETSRLNEEQKIIACALAKAAGAAFVKTSTGLDGGATVEDVALMRRIVGGELGVKASGGIRSLDDASKMVAAGASRIGASCSVAIVTEIENSAF